MEEILEVPHDELWVAWNGNYYLKEKRPCNIELYDFPAEGKRKPFLSTTCYMKNRGQTSRARLPRSLLFTASEDITGSRKFPKKIFKDEEQTHSFLMFAGGNDVKYELKDYLVNSLASEMSFATIDYIPAALFLEGEYWGTYLMSEDYDADFISEHYGVSTDNIIMLKNDELKEGRLGLDDMILNDAIQEVLNADDFAYDKANELFDMDCLIDYFSTECYIANRDVFTNNEVLWRSRSKNDKSYEDGKWRWMIYDLNHSSVMSDPNYDNVEFALEQSELFAVLFKDADFKQRFFDRLLYLSEHVFSDENVDNFIDTYLKKNASPLNDSIIRFHGTDGMTDINENAEYVRYFFHQRHKCIEEQITKYSIY